MRVARVGFRSAAFLTSTAASVYFLNRAKARAPDRLRTELKDVHLKRYVSRVMRVLRIQTRYEPALPAPRTKRGRLVVANHQSAVDIGILLGYFGGACLSRGDLAQWPLLGWAARSVDTIFVDRDDVHSGASALRAIRRRLREGGTVVAFPEGKTSLGDEVLPFQPGVFAAARGIDCEIMPVGIAYKKHNAYVDKTFLEHLSSVAADPEAAVSAAVGTPLEVAGRSTELAEHAQTCVQKLVKRARDSFAEGHGL